MAVASVHVPLQLRAHELDDRAGGGHGKRRCGGTNQAAWRRRVWTGVKSDGFYVGFAAPKP
jgi:hypothetical protein